MSDSYIQTPDDSSNTGKRLDTELVNNGSEDVHRERHQVVGRAFAEIADVKNADPTTEYGLVTRNISTAADIARVGATNETAPVTDTGTSGQNGRLQRIAQRLTTLITNLGTQVFGAGTAATAQRTTLASDDPAVTVLGATGDASVTGDNTGSISAKLRGINKILADVWDSANNRLKVVVQNTTLAVTQSGTWTVLRTTLAVAHNTAPSATAAASQAPPIASRHGVPFVHNGHPDIKTYVYNTDAARTDDNIISTFSSGTKFIITGYHVRLSSAATVAVSVLLGFGASTLAALGSTGADGVATLIDYHPSLVPGSGFGVDGCYIPCADGEEPRVTNSVPTGGVLSIVLRGFFVES